MKKLLILFLALNLTSCEDFLSENVRGIISPNNFYNSDQEAIQAANGLYLGFRTGTTKVGMASLLSSFS